MLRAAADDGAYVFIGKGIDNLLAVAAVFNKVALAEDAKLVGDGGEGDANFAAEICNVELFFAEGAEDFEPGGIGKDFKQIGEVKN